MPVRTLPADWRGGANQAAQLERPAWRCTSGLASRFRADGRMPDRCGWPRMEVGSITDLIRARSRLVFDPVEVLLRTSVPRHVKEYGVHCESSSMPKISLAGRVSFSPAKPQIPICGSGVPRTCGIWRPWRRNRAERERVIPPISHCVFRGELAAKLWSAPIMPIVIMIDIDDHADGANHAGSDDHHDGGGT
jgi:hypothetical protein